MPLGIIGTEAPWGILAVIGLVILAGGGPWLIRRARGSRRNDSSSE